MNYKEAGVDVQKASRLLKDVSSFITESHNDSVLGNIGGFGAFYRLGDQVLVSGSDGVGTKLLLAKKQNDYSGIGQDLVAMCVNDIICHGAKPLFFHDYYASSKLDEKQYLAVLKSISHACKKTSIALIGGETAELPGLYQENDFDLAGFAVGLVDEKKLIDGSKVQAGDVLIGLSSSGFHSNGYSLIRKVLEEVPQLGAKYQKELLEPTTLYYPILKELEDIDIHGISHITGGGFYENIPRMFQHKKLAFSIKNYQIPTMFSDFMIAAGLGKEEAFSTFNMGIGMVLSVYADDAAKIIERCEKMGQQAQLLGEVERASRNEIL